MSNKLALKTKSTKKDMRSYEAETLALQSLRLIAAPNPKDDLNEEELADYYHDSRYSPEMIRHIIEFVKSL